VFLFDVLLEHRLQLLAAMIAGFCDVREIETLRRKVSTAQYWGRFSRFPQLHIA
jgi:hypothetical protein